MSWVDPDRITPEERERSMTKLKVAFDCDDTLITWLENGRAVPDWNIIKLMRWFQENGHDVIVWSGGGVDYAKEWVEKFNLYWPGNDPRVIEKGSEVVDLAIDDMGHGDPVAREYIKQELKSAKVTIVV